MGISALKRRSNTQVSKKTRKNVSILSCFETFLVKNESLLGWFLTEIEIYVFKTCVNDRVKRQEPEASP